MKKYDSGYTLVELSVVLALAGMVVLGSIAGASYLISVNKINQITAQSADAITRLERAYGPLSSYAGLTLRQAVSFGAFNQFVVAQPATSNVAVTHTLGGAVGVAPLPGTAPLAWGVYLDAIPAQHCSELVYQAAPLADALIVFPGGMGNPVGWAGGMLRFDAAVPAVTVSAGNLTSTAPVIAKNLTVDVSPSSIATACSFVGDSFGVLLIKSKLK